MELTHKILLTRHMHIWAETKSNKLILNLTGCKNFSFFKIFDMGLQASSITRCGTALCSKVTVRTCPHCNSNRTCGPRKNF